MPDAAPSSSPLLRLAGVVASYGDTEVLHGVDLAVNAGEVVVLMGPSGAGKSTLCRTINALQPIDAGSITLAGVELPTTGAALSAWRANAAMVFQQFNLFGHLSVLENVTLGPVRVRGADPAAAREEAMTLLASVGVADQAGKKPAELSGGQQQRVAIARALAMHPALLLLDEPTSALDPAMVGEVLDVMTGLAAGGTTMVVVTHEVGFARRAAHRVVLLADGRIAEQAAPAAFFSSPASAQGRAFLAHLAEA